MTKVQCGFCGNIQESFAQVFFNCNGCRRRNLIENSVFQESLPHGNRKGTDVQTQPRQELPTPLGKADAEAHPAFPVPVKVVNEEKPVIEIQDVEPDAVPEEYKCPHCNSPVERFGDCTNPQCLAEIFWRE